MMEKNISIRNAFLNQIRNIIAEAQEKAVRAVDFQRVLMYWNIGKTIFEEEQQGQERAEYGTYLIKHLSKELEPEYGTSFSVRQLELSSQFFRTFPISNPLPSPIKLAPNTP